MSIKDEFNMAIEKNDITFIKDLLKLKKINPSMNCNYPIRCAVRNGHIEIVKLLLEDSRVDPSEYSNCSIKVAIFNNNEELVKILWNDQRLKTSLKNKEMELYKLLTKNEIQTKINGFIND
jgi:ankyrin repeat protein